MLHSASRSAGCTRREREIMDAIFALGNRASAESIRSRLLHPPSDSAVRVMLARLEKKGQVRHEREGVRYLYSATIAPSVAKRRALVQYLDTFFDGSVSQLVRSLVAGGSWSDEDLKSLREEINRRYVERKTKT